MKKPNYKSIGKIRIIGGQWKRRKLPVLNIPGLYPTTCRIRETLFNWLAPSIIDARCLDCFAGSGILGLEALSRGASNATLLEIKYNVVEQLQKNLAILKTSNAIIMNSNTLNFLAKPGTMYDIVFVDPPFYKGLVKRTLFLLEKNGWLAEKALIYVESELENCSQLVPLNWTFYRGKVTGRVFYRLYYRNL